MPPYWFDIFDDWTSAKNFQRRAIQNCLDMGWAIRAAEIGHEVDFTTKADRYSVLVRPFIEVAGDELGVPAVPS